MANGEVANSACVGFGLERIVLALFAAHGLARRGMAIRRESCTRSVIRLLPIEAATYVESRCTNPERDLTRDELLRRHLDRALHTLELDAHAALAFTISVDFDGDQWQFFKFPLEDLRFVYGLEVLGDESLA